MKGKRRCGGEGKRMSGCGDDTKIAHGETKSAYLKLLLSRQKLVTHDANEEE